MIAQLACGERGLHAKFMSGNLKAVRELGKNEDRLCAGNHVPGV